MNKLIIAFLLIVTLGGIFYIINKGDTAPLTTNVSSYTLAEVMEHDDATSCWSTINGNVYDLTSWINMHPGGQEAILFTCGKDATEAFNTQHEGQENPATALEGFIIGELSQ